MKVIELTERWMPLLGTNGLAVRMSVLSERGAQANHYQSLEVLASRGGLDAGEVLAIMLGKPRERRPGQDDATELLELAIALKRLAR